MTAFLQVFLNLLFTAILRLAVENALLNDMKMRCSVHSKTFGDFDTWVLVT
jgi:hypothetical protein